jgi:hypothetical protein
MLETEATEEAGAMILSNLVVDQKLEMQLAHPKIKSLIMLMASPRRTMRNVALNWVINATFNASP